jgi:YesN/AraC family two-component response regulator
VSDAVGFADVTHFSRIFKKMENMSANEYRNKQIAR